jgi:hypothetical protein
MAGAAMVGGFSGLRKTSSQSCPHRESFSPRLPLHTVLSAARGHGHASHILWPVLQVRHLYCFVPFPAGFIDFIVEPTFSVLTDVAEKSVQPLVDDDSKSKNQPR